jgi:hypothetical protein
MPLKRVLVLYDVCDQPYSHSFDVSLLHFGPNVPIHWMMRPGMLDIYPGY